MRRAREETDAVMTRFVDIEEVSGELRGWRTRLIVPLVGLVGALGLAACGSSDDDSSDSTSLRGAAARSPSCCPETETARYETQDKPLFEQKVEELCPDCDILYQNADQDPTKQQSQVEALVTQGVDVIVLDPVDSTSAAGMVTRAQQADIPVISYDRLILNADLAAYAEFNSPEVGKQQGTALTRSSPTTATRPGPIVQINGDPKDNNAKLFKEGATSVFQAKGDRRRPGVRHPRLAAGERPEGDGPGDHGDSARTASTASSPPTTAPPAARSRRSRRAGIDPTTIPVTGQDAELAAIQRILAGEQYMTVYKPIKPLADNAATLAVAVVNGEDPASSDVINGDGGQRDRAGAGGDHRHDPRVRGQRQGHGGQGRVLDARRRSARSSTRRTARTQVSSRQKRVAGSARRGER